MCLWPFSSSRPAHEPKELLVPVRSAGSAHLQREPQSVDGGEASARSHFLRLLLRRAAASSSVGLTAQCVNTAPSGLIYIHTQYISPDTVYCIYQLSHTYTAQAKSVSFNLLRFLIFIVHSH